MATERETKAWESQKSRLRNRFTVLRDEDLNFDESGKKEMLSRLHAKLGLSEQRLETIMEGK